MNLPIASEVVDLTSANYTFTRDVQAIRSNVAGTFYATLRGEGGVAEGSRPFTVLVGDIVPGEFVSVQRATSDAGFQNATALLGLILARRQR